MKIRHLLLFVGYLSLSVFVVHAQDGGASPNNYVLVIGIGAIFIIAMIAVLMWRRTQSLSRDVLDDPHFGIDEDPTVLIDVNQAPPVLFETPSVRPTIERADNDMRPYLVIELRKSSNTFLRAGERWIINPDDTPFLIGSRTGCDLRILDNHVSNEHIRIEFDASTYEFKLTDYNSSNGSRWDGDTMVKKRPYKMSNRRDVSLEIAVSYVFTLYIDEVETLHAAEGSPFEVKNAAQVKLPSQAALPEGVNAHLNWYSPETGTEQELQLTDVVTMIGRGDHVDSQINHHLVSKLHAYIIWKDNQFWLVDMSSNGTWLTTGAQGRVRLEYGEYVALDADTMLVIEVARDVITLEFQYSKAEKDSLKTMPITDKLPELPTGVQPLLHIVRDGENEQRKEVQISTSIITIGRTKNNILRFERDSIADEHAKIVWEEGRFWMYDLSGMGTTVDEKKLHRTRMPLDKRIIYQICINEGQADEIRIAFYYDAQIDSDNVATLPMTQAHPTQRIDTNVP